MVEFGQVFDDVQARAGTLLDKYQVPPFSILDTRQGYWQEARRAWLALGIKSEVGRPLAADGRAETEYASTSRTGVEGVSRAATTMGHITVGTAPEIAARFESVGYNTSIFDPVVCELAYRWWCPPGGTVLDPFAGGSVRGIVAAWMGHAYTGVDLSPRQVQSNRDQANVIMSGRPKPTWIVGDSRTALPELGSEWADFIFTCPPYYDLEVYSDDPADLSAMQSWPAFLDAYGDVIGASLAALKRDRFAAVVVSEIRGPNGIFRGLVPWTIRQFELHGARYYNEAIIVNSAGTLPLRIGRQFDAGRKLGRSHQNLLVFVKGEPPKTHEWGYEGTAAPAPQLEMFDIPGSGSDGRAV